MTQFHQPLSGQDIARGCDLNAIAVYHQAGQLGFLHTNDLAQRLSPALDAGEEVTAKVVNVTRVEVPEIALELALQV